MFPHYFFFNKTAPPEISTLSLHAALPISPAGRAERQPPRPERAAVVVPRRVGEVAAREEGHAEVARERPVARARDEDRKSTRLNSSHANISSTLFCLKKNHASTTSSRSRE